MWRLAPTRTKGRLSIFTARHQSKTQHDATLARTRSTPITLSVWTQQCFSPTLCGACPTQCCDAHGFRTRTCCLPWHQLWQASPSGLNYREATKSYFSSKYNKKNIILARSIPLHFPCPLWDKHSIVLREHGGGREEPSYFSSSDSDSPSADLEWLRDFLFSGDALRDLDLERDLDLDLDLDLSEPDLDLDREPDFERDLDLERLFLLWPPLLDLERLRERE